MRVFISWSGSQSRQVAIALRDWLPAVINCIRPFVSSKDVHAGSRWQPEIASELDASNFGIVVVTRENQRSPWLNFEAGALAKAVDTSRVVPLAIDLSPSDVDLPLGQFQAQPATEAGLAEILASINAACEAPLGTPLLTRAYEKWWPEIDTELQRIHRGVSSSVPPPPMRSERELLEELVDSVRSLTRRSTRLLARPPSVRPRPREPVVREIVAAMKPHHIHSMYWNPDEHLMELTVDERLTIATRDRVLAIAASHGVEVRFHPTHESAESTDG